MNRNRPPKSGPWILSSMTPGTKSVLLAVSVRAGTALAVERVCQSTAALRCHLENDPREVFSEGLSHTGPQGRALRNVPQVDMSTCAGCRGDRGQKMYFPVCARDCRPSGWRKARLSRVAERAFHPEG